MPFAIGETIGGLNHLFLRWQRCLLRQPVTRHVGSCATGGVKVKTVLDDNGAPKTCHICGFAIARLDLTGGWMIETCSAVGLDTLVANRRFDEWASELARTPDGHCASRYGPGSSAEREEIVDSSVSSASSLPGKLL